MKKLYLDSVQSKMALCHSGCKWKHLLQFRAAGVLFAFILINVGALSGQITQVGTAQTSIGTTSVTLTKPAGVTTDDFLIVTIAYNETSANIDLNVAPTGPTGWILLQDVNLDNGNGDEEWRGAVFYKRAVASDITATNYQFSLDNDADGAVGGIIAFRGVHLTTPFDVPHGTINVTNSSTITATSKTTVTSNAAIVMLAMVSDDNSISNWTTTSPGSLTELFDAGTTTGGDNQVGAAWAIKPSPGPTGNGTATMGATDENGGIILVLRQGCNVDFGTLASGNQTFCPGTHDPSEITFSSMPSGGPGSYTYQWFYQDGLVTCPSGSSTSGWTMIGGATNETYDPPSGLSASRTYAVQVFSVGNTDCPDARWASGCRQITVLPSINYGTVSNGDQTLCPDGNPVNITLSTNPSGGTTIFTYQWYYQDGIQDCPSGSDNTGWTMIPAAVNSTYDPPIGLTVSRTYALMVDPAGSPDCGGPTWANNCRKVTIIPLIDYGTLEDEGETICNGGDPSTISFETGPSGGAGSFVYQWYFQNGTPACPTGSSTIGWTIITGANSSSYDPPPGLTATRTYAVRVDPTGSPDCSGPFWASGCWTVTVLPAVNLGTIASGDEFFCSGVHDPGNITFSSMPSGGTGSFTYQWYYQDGLPSCPSGTNTSGWTLIVDATGSSYDPPSGVTSSRVYAVQVDAVGSPDCGEPTWANSCRRIIVNAEVDFGTIAGGDAIVCHGGDPAAITFSTAPSGGSGTFTYQWFYKDGLQDCPTGTESNDWVLIGGATANNYNPPSGLTTSRTYAVMVNPAGSPDCGVATWAGGCRRITTLPPIDYGTLTFADEAYCNGSQNPAEITFSTPPSGGSGSFTYQWYFQNALPSSCPTGSGTGGWTSIGGATGSSYDPPAGLTQSRTYAVLVTPAGSPVCGSGVWASGCRKINISTGTPGQPSVISGPGASCSNGLIGPYSVTNVSGVTYTWTITGTGFSIASGQGSNSVTINTGSTFPQTLTVTPSNACGPGTPRTFTVSNTISYCMTCTTCPEIVVPNPVMSGECANLKIALVLDESNSISGNQPQQVAEGVLAFANTLSCTEVHLSVIEFRGNARFVLDGYQIVDNTITAAMQAYFNGTPHPSLLNGATYTPGAGPGEGGTNYQAGLLAVDALPETPDLVVFFTDGDPTAFFTNNNPLYSQSSNISNNCTNGSQIGNAVKVANKLKCQGAHIFAYGVTGAASASLQAITGTVQYQNGVNSIANSDYVIGNFGGLAQGLAGFVEQLCPFDTDIVSQDVCAGGSDGSIAVYVPEGLHPFDIAYFVGDSDIPSGTDTGIEDFPYVISNLSAGPYRIEVLVTLTGSQCTRTEIFYDTIVADANDVISTVIDLTHPNCDELDIGTATLNITTGVPPFSITLKKSGVTEPGYPVMQNDFVHIATGLDFGMYAFEVQDVNMCNTDTTTFVIDEPQNCCPENCILTDGPSSEVCPGTLSEFGISIDDCVNPIYAWTLVNTINGATIPGASNGPTVTVDAGLCGEYTIQVSVTCDGCEPLICEKTITVEDIEVPSFTRPADITLYMDGTCNYDADVSVTGDVMDEVDNCFTGLEATFTDEAGEGPCASSFVITRTWILADGCGNEAAEQIQTITVLDNIAPTFTAPTDLIIYRDAGCAYDADPSETGDVTDETDNCGTGEASYEDGIDSTNPCEIVITRTWSLTDDCGNTAADQIQMITVRDNTPPTFTAPDGIVLYRDENCNYDASILMTGDVMDESDNCGTGEATFEDEVDETDPCEVTITRTWSLVDDCGNPAIDQIQQITILDNTAPTFTRPSDITIEMNAGCAYDADPTVTGDVLNEADNCSTGLQADYSDVTLAGPCTGSFVITRTWTLIDDCGNAAGDQVQTITIIDSADPVIEDCPETRNLQGCGTTAITGPVYSPTPSASTIGVFEDMTNNGLATDNCGIASVTYVDVAAGTCPIVVTRTWTITDACGNSSTCNQTINIYDTTPPIIDLCPVDRNLVGCGTGAITSPIYATTTTSTTIGVFTNSPNFGLVTDNCGTSTVTYRDVATGTCPIIVTRTWTITDLCGNPSTCNQTITITDNVAPVIDNCPIVRNLVGCSPAVITGPAYSTTTTASTLGVFGNLTNFGSVIENCVIASVTYRDVATGVCPIIVTRTWTITDACGNSDTCNQTITITDNTNPLIDLCPIPRNLQGCSPSVITGPNYSITTTPTTLGVFGSTTNFGLASDNCNVTSVTYSDLASGSCPIVVTRTWTVFDACGNSATCNQLIMVHDTTSPVIVCPADITLLSSDSTLPANTGTASATDNCDASPSVTYTDEIVSAELIIRTWTALDDCGNMQSCEQEITIESLGTICGSVFDDLGQPMSSIEIRLMADLNSNETVDGGDTLVAVEFSNGSGEFCFAQILAGEYVLLEIQPTPYGSLSDYDTSTDPVNDPDGNDSADGPDNEIPVTLVPDEDDLDNDFVNIICPVDLPVIPNDTICENGGVVFEIDDVNLGTLTYDWDFGSGSNPPTASGLGPHQISYTGTPENQSTGAVVQLTISKDGCMDLTGPVSLVKVNPYPNATIDGSTSSGCYYTNRIFEPVAPEIPGATYQWNFGTAAVPPTAIGYGPHSVYYTTTGSKTVKLVIHPNEDGVQCPDSSTLNFNITLCPGFILGFVRTETGAPIGSVNVRLFADADANGLPDSPTHVMSVNTNSGGGYTFPGITPGHYVIIQTQPTGWFSLDDYDDSDDGDVVPNIDSLDNLIPVTLLPSEVDSFNYFIETAIPGSITGAVFDDMDGDELPDPGEGIPGVIISLYTDNNTNGLPDSGTPVDTAMTGSTGNYSFTNIPVGHYVLVETQPSGYVSIRDYDQSNDGDAVPNTNMNNDIIPVTVTNMELDAHNYFVEDLATVGIFCPPDVTIPCHADTSPSNTGVATGTSNCSALTIIHSDVSSQHPNADSCGHFTYEITRTWVATDTCGAFNTCVQTISVADVTAPVWTTPSGTLDITLECSDAAGLIAAQTVFPVADDNCDADVTNIVKIPGAFVEGSCPQAGTITNTWTVTDACGNISLEFFQVINIIDTTPPIWLTTSPTQLDITVECSDSEGLEDAQAMQPVAIDACAGFLITVNEVSGPFVEGPCPEAGTYTNVFVLSDNCGNDGPTYSQVITVVDSSPPVWVTSVTVLDTMLDCSDAVGLAAAQALFPEAVDNCDTDVTDIIKTAGVFVPGLCPTSGTYTNTWTVADNCGNLSAIYTQVITLVDTTAPIIETEAGFLDRTLDCTDGVGLDEALGLVPAAFDDCDNGPQIHLLSDETTPDENCPDAYIRVRVWNFTDGCSNTSQSFSQTIVISDNAAPVFTKPADITIYSDASCDYDASLEVTGDVEDETDNCSIALEATYNEDIQQGSCEGNLVITRTWTLVDDCFNAAADQIQIITVLDTFAPAFTRPADITIYTNEVCAYNAIPAITGMVVDVTDNCSTALEATYEDDLEEGECEGTWTIIRTWSLTDDCGNAAPQQIQTITVLDNTAPSFTRPADITLYTDENCVYDATPDFAGDVTDEVDNCSDALVASFEDEVVEGLCEGTWIITRTWSLTDLCGNEADDQIQMITILDNSPPAFTRPADITIVTTDGCGFDPDPTWTGDVTNESDNCSTGLQATYEDEIDDGICNDIYVITRTWSLMDDCGNAAGDQVQSITVRECNLMVMNTSDDGTASLRHAIGCAQDGDTIRFHSSLAGLTITINTAKLIVDKNLVIMSTLFPRVMVASAIDGLFDITDGSVVEFRDLDILSGPMGTEGAAFKNEGILLLHNMHVYRNMDLPMGLYLIRNRPASHLILSGNCLLQME